MSDIKKIINPARGPNGPIFCKIEIKRKNDIDCLSISGVEGPMSNGDARGSCGQIEMGYWHRNPDHNDKRYSNPVRPSDLKFSDGWTQGMWLEFLEIWHDWHMNDMRPGCKHQTGPDWPFDKELEVQEYTQVGTNFMDIGSLIKLNRATPEEVRLADLSKSVFRKLLIGSVDTFPAAEIAELEAANMLKKSKATKKTARWVYPYQHPDGLLAKPCGVCGYKYGASWLAEAVPQEKLVFLLNLPDSTVKPAWV